MKKLFLMTAVLGIMSTSAFAGKGGPCDPPVNTSRCKPWMQKTNQNATPVVDTAAAAKIGNKLDRLDRVDGYNKIGGCSDSSPCGAFHACVNGACQSTGSLPNVPNN